MSRKKRRIAPFRFAPFSKKQLQVLTWWADSSPYRDYDIVIADGSIRSGKTVSMGLSFVLWAMSSFNGQNFAICGKTIHSCRRNVIQPLKQMLVSRGYEIADIRNENLIIISSREMVGGKEVITENNFYLFGGKDEGSQDLIQGITLAGLFCDEVVLMPESFVNQATGRCSVTGSKMWFCCNPGSPKHYFKVEWIDKQEKRRILYLHFTMDDNPSLSPQVRERYERMYAGVFRDRFILGLWVSAEGLVYPMFSEETHVMEKHLYWDRVFIAGDFGIYNATTFGLYGYHRATNSYHLIKSYWHSGRVSEKNIAEAELDDNIAPMAIAQKTTKEYADELVKLAEGYMIDYIILDPAASALIIELQKHPYIRRRKIDVIPAKNDVILGITFHAELLADGKFTLDPSNTYDIDEYYSYSWDPKKSDLGKDEVIKKDDHCMDRNRYACLTDALINDNFGFLMEVISGKGARLT